MKRAARRTWRIKCLRLTANWIRVSVWPADWCVICTIFRISEPVRGSGSLIPLTGPSYFVNVFWSRASLFDGYTLTGYDEMFAAPGRPAPHYAALHRSAGDSSAPRAGASPSGGRPDDAASGDHLHGLRPRAGGRADHPVRPDPPPGRRRRMGPDRARAQAAGPCPQPVHPRRLPRPPDPPGPRRPARAGPGRLGLSPRVRRPEGAAATSTSTSRAST